MKYTVGSKEFHTEKKALSVRKILENAGYQPEAHYLLSNSGEEFRDLDAPVRIEDGAAFEAKPGDNKPGGKAIRYAVNGEPQETAKAKLSFEELLTNAGAAAGIDPKKVSEHDLVDDRTGVRYEAGSVVLVKEGDRFLAIYKGQTTVA